MKVVVNEGDYVGVLLHKRQLALICARFAHSSAELTNSELREWQTDHDEAIILPVPSLEEAARILGDTSTHLVGGERVSDLNYMLYSASLDVLKRR